MKTALDYAQESMKWYEDHSILNPLNRSSFVLAGKMDEWNKIYQEQKIITYLETILERLPYECSQEFKCPIGTEGCTENCGNYGCGN